MKVKTLHPDEITFHIVEEGIANGYLARDIHDLIQERTKWTDTVVMAQISTLTSRHQIYRHIVKDDVLGKLLFYTFEKPLKPVIKHIGSVVYADKTQNGSDLRAAGLKTFGKAKKDKVAVAPYHIPCNLKKVVPKFVRTKFSTSPSLPPVCRFTRTKFPKVKFTRTK